MEEQRNKIANKILGGNRFHPYDKEFKNARVGADSISAQCHRDIITYHGITLIALVITIIILLILAGVVINLTLGEHGIIKMAEKAGKNYVNAAEDEQKKLGDLLNEADNIINGTGNGSNPVIPPLLSSAVAGSDIHTAKHIQYTWEELSELAKLISNNYGTGAGQINNNTAEINISLNGKSGILGIGDWTTVNGYQVRILGFNHDELANQTIYGGTNTYAGISFEFTECITTTAMNSSATNAGGWEACELRGILNSTTYESLENKLYIKEVNKQYISTYNDADSVTTTLDKLWLLSFSEIWNVEFLDVNYGIVVAAEGEQYKYYKNIDVNSVDENTSLIKSMNVSSERWWLRSPTYTRNDRFYYIDKAGGCSSGSAPNTNGGVSPGFAI